MTEEVRVLVTPIESGKYVSFDAEGASKIVFSSDATQLAQAMSLMRFPKGTLLEMSVREAPLPFSEGCAECGRTEIHAHPGLE